MIKLGITGGIGSGKTYVSTLFNKLGLPVFNSDNEAIKAYSDPIIQQQIVDVLGNESYHAGYPNKAFIASKIFAEPDLLKSINQVIHPWVRQSFKNWTDSLAGSSLVIQEAAILFESGAYKNLDFTLCIYADEKIRIKRIQERNGWTVNEIKKRMENQWSDERKLALADFSLRNNGNDELLQPVLEIYKELTKI